MTGQDFQKLMKRMGYTQMSLAERFGVARETIRVRCQMAQVDELYCMAMLGLMAEHAAQDLVLAVEAVRAP